MQLAKPDTIVRTIKALIIMLILVTGSFIGSNTFGENQPNSGPLLSQSQAYCKDASRQFSRGRQDIEETRRQLEEGRRKLAEAKRDPAKSNATSGNVKQSEADVQRLEASIKNAEAELKAGEAEMARECKKS